MTAGVHEIYGTYYYTHGFGLLLVAPFAFWFFVSLIGVPIRAIERKPVKWHGLVISAICTAVMLVAVFWDVYQIGQQATKLCNEKAGLHVYRTAEVESFLGAAGIRGWAEYGFEFTEGESDKDKIRYFMENGKPTYKKIDHFLSQYELLITRKKLTKKIMIHEYKVIDRSNNEILGVAAKLGIDAGWADMFFYGITGFSYSPWICAEKVDGHILNPGDIVKATLKSVNK